MREQGEQDRRKSPAQWGAGQAAQWPPEAQSPPAHPVASLGTMYMHLRIVPRKDWALRLPTTPAPRGAFLPFAMQDVGESCSRKERDAAGT